ncbi:hypothetical protein LguiA_013506 [Lonicera macranthoides]
MTSSSVIFFYIAHVLLIIVISLPHNQSYVNPTHGFTKLPFNTSYYQIQKPYDLAVDQRYRFTHGVHKLWVYSTDNPLSADSPTKPRTEISITGYNYSYAAWQFEGHAYVPKGTSGVCIMQVYGANPPHASTLMLRVYNDVLTYYQAANIVVDIYDRWFRVNVIHEIEANKLQVYINRVLKFEAPGRGGQLHHFKFGVYSQNNDTHYMESRWKNIKIFKKTC